LFFFLLWICTAAAQCSKEGDGSIAVVVFFFLFSSCSKDGDGSIVELCCNAFFFFLFAAQQRR
jgi:hypothetical protein